MHTPGRRHPYLPAGKQGTLIISKPTHPDAHSYVLQKSIQGHSIKGQCPLVNAGQWD